MKKKYEKVKYGLVKIILKTKVEGGKRSREKKRQRKSEGRGIQIIKEERERNLGARIETGRTEEKERLSQKLSMGFLSHCLRS